MNEEYLDPTGLEALLIALKPYMNSGGAGSITPIGNNLLEAIAKGEYVPADALGANAFLNAPGLDQFWRYIGPKVSGGTPVRAIAKADYEALSDLEKDSDVLWILTNSSRQYPTSLNLMSWADVSKISADGTFGNYFKVGDTKRIFLNGKFFNQGPTYNNIPLDLVVVGIDHNQDKESPGEHRVHWLAGMLDGKNVCLTPDPDTYSAQTTRDGGCIQGNNVITSWNECPMNKITLAGHQAPTIRVTNSLANILPDDLRAVMKSVRKSSLMKNKSDMEFIESYVTFPSLVEITAATSWYERATQETYTFFKPIDGVDEGSKRASVDILSGQSRIWWTRSSDMSSLRWMRCLVTGGTSSTEQNWSLAIRPLLFT